MKIYMSVDMEGIGGIALKEQVMKGNREYEEARHLLVKEVNAAIDSALEAGAEEIIVLDGHGSGFNLPLEELHPKAKYFMGARNKSTERFPFLDSSFDMMMLIGYHAMAGTESAVRDHTQNSSTIEKVIINELEVGEVGLDAIYCGSLGVPIGLVTGDDKVCLEAKALLPEVETAVVKFSNARHSALMYAPKVSREIVKQAVYNAVKKANQFKPYKLEKPYDVEIQYLSTDIADGIYTDGVRRIRKDSRTILYKNVSLSELF
jgi:D-amino peptidase